MACAESLNVFPIAMRTVDKESIKVRSFMNVKSLEHSLEMLIAPVAIVRGSIVRVGTVNGRCSV